LADPNTTMKPIKTTKPAAAWGQHAAAMRRSVEVNEAEIFHTCGQFALVDLRCGVPNPGLCPGFARSSSPCLARDQPQPVMRSPAGFLLVGDVSSVFSDAGCKSPTAGLKTFSKRVKAACEAGRRDLNPDQSHFLADTEHRHEAIITVTL